MSGKRWRLIQLFAATAALLAMMVGAWAPAATQAQGSMAQKVAQSGTKISNTAQAPESFAGLSGKVSLMLEMNDPAATVVFANSNPSGRKGDSVAANISRDQVNRNEQAQQSVLRQITNSRIDAAVIYRVQKAYNGIAVRVDASEIARLQSLEGVKAVHILHTQSVENAGSVPLIRAPQAWESYGATGEGMSIAVIDTGIDYVHTDFGGSGDYTGCDTTVITDTGCIFPTAKVVGGYDFAGNDYDADGVGAAAIPQPDPDPIDCNGHGSHVSGTAAGYGVNSDGSTYEGPYDTTTPFTQLRIGPGVAPGASLYALKVFGCEGTTSLTVAAIDWATDPNGDGDLSDHVDVINMSLGSAFGSAYDPSAVAANNAVLAGVIVATSAGNEGDATYINGAPGIAARAISTAWTYDALDTTDGFRVNAPDSIDGVYPASESVNYDWASPPITHPVPITTNVYYPATNQYGCAAWTDANDLANIAGKIVLVDWRKVGDTTFPCGSVARSNNATAAGAAGIIMADNTPGLDTSISGNAAIPAMYTVKSVGDALKSALTAGQPSNVSVTLTHEYHATVKLYTESAVDTLSVSSSRGPARGGGVKPDIAAPGQSIFSAAVGTGNQGMSIQGTSMSTPHTAGTMALVREQHPDWTVEELKALVMNTASHDVYTGQNRTGLKYSPQRVGAGRIDVKNAIDGEVVAYNDDDSGTVSVSFGFVEVVSTLTTDKTVRVYNSGTTARTYNLSYDARSVVPGVSYTFPGGNSVTIPAGGETTFVVRLTANPAQMLYTHDATLTTTQGGLARFFLSEASGLIMLTPAAPTEGNVSDSQLRVPVYANIRRASAMSTEENNLVVSGNSVTTTLTLTGTGFVSTPPTGTISLVTALELQGVSPALAPINNPIGQQADLQYVGVGSDYNGVIAAGNPMTTTSLYFGLSTFGNWDAPGATGEVEFDLYIDTDRDGTDDYVLYNQRLTDSAGDYTDVFVSNLVDLNNGGSTLENYINGFAPDEVTTAVFNTNVMVMSVAAADLGISSDTKFNYSLVTFAREADFAVDVAGPFTYDFARPGIDFSGDEEGQPTYVDVPGAELPVSYNGTNFGANASLGALLLHHFNTAGNRAQVLPVQVIEGPPSTATVTATALPTETYSDVNEGDYFYQAVNWLYGRGATDAAPLGSGTFKPYDVATRAVIVKMIVIANGLAIDTTGGPHFSDVPASHPYYSFIETARNRGIISGYANGTFAPDAAVTRGQIAKIVVGAQGWAILNPATPTFSDVARDNPFYKEIETAVAHYIISGYDCTDAVDQPCPGRIYKWYNNATRGQVAKIVYLAVTTPELQ